MTQENNTKLVQMRLRPKTLRAINSLSKSTDNKNKTHVVASAIHLTNEIIQTISTGGKLCIEDKNGYVQNVKFITI